MCSNIATCLINFKSNKRLTQSWGMKFIVFETNYFIRRNIAQIWFLSVCFQLFILQGKMATYVNSRCASEQGEKNEKPDKEQ